MRSAVLDNLTEDYVRTAFAYGLPRRDVYFRYALKATLIPLLTVIGLTYGYLLGGAVVAEPPPGPKPPWSAITASSGNCGANPSLTDWAAGGRPVL